MPAPTITRAEWVRVAAFAAVVMALSLAPYLVGWASQTPDMAFSGFIIGAEDGYSYLGKMRLGVDGHWQFYLFYTPEPHAAAPLTYLNFLIPGQILRPFIDADSPALYSTMLVMFHVSRVLFGALLIAVVYRFIAGFIEGAAGRFVALVLATLGGGLGLVLIPFGALPPEFYIPEAFTFLLLLTLPHLVLARAAMLGGFIALFASLSGSGGRYGWAVLAGALWLVTGLGVPFYMAVIYAVLGVWGLLLWARDRRFPWDAFVRAVIAGGITLPLFAFFYWTFAANPMFAQWSAQNTLPSPPPLHYLLAYGPYLLAGAFAVRHIWREPSERGILLLAWVLVGLLLVYLPLNVQRRLGEGVLIPLAIVAVLGLESLRVRPGVRALWRGALLTTALVTTLTLYVAMLSATSGGNRELFVPRDTIAAYNWLNANAIERERGAVVLAPYPVGNKLPAYTNLRPFVGHGPESVNGLAKRALLDRYLAGDMPPDEQRDLLDTYTIDYVLLDIPPPENLVDLRELHAVDEVRVYAVDR